MNNLVPRIAVFSLLAGVTALIACGDIAGPSTSLAEQDASPMEIAHPPTPFSFEFEGCTEVVRVEGQAMSVQLPGDIPNPGGHVLYAYRTIAWGTGEGLTSGAMYRWSFQEIFTQSSQNIAFDEQVSDSYQQRTKLIGQGNIPNLHVVFFGHSTQNHHGEPTASIWKAEAVCR